MTVHEADLLWEASGMSLNYNIYFDGGVQSVGYERDGMASSVGVMAAGEYHFGTATAERMTIVQGELTVQLPGAGGWQTFGPGGVFDVPGDSGFDVRVVAPTSYLCEYL